MEINKNVFVKLNKIKTVLFNNLRFISSPFFV